MATNYPGALDSFTNPTATDNLNSTTVPHADQHTNANDSIRAIEVTLGVNPQGGAATVVARLNALDATVASKAASVSGSGAISVTAGTTPTISVASASVSTAGVVQLTDSTSSTSTTTAATPASVKSAYDLAAGKAGLATANTFTTGTQVIQAGADGTVALRVQRNGPSATADIAQFAMSTGTPLAKIDKDGKITAADFIDSSMTTAGIVKNDSTGLFTSVTALNQSDLNGVAVSTWLPNTAYTKGDLASYNGITYRRVSTGSSSSNFVATNWQQVTPLNTFAGRSQLTANRTLANTSTASPVFVDNSGTVVYLNLEPDKTYFFEGWFQLATSTTTALKNPSINFFYVDGSLNNLTAQSFSLSAQVTTSAAFYNIASLTAPNTDTAIAGTTATAGAAYYGTFRGFIRTSTSTSVAHRINLGLGQTSSTGATAGPQVVPRTYMNVVDMGTGLNAITGYWTA